MKYCWPIIWVSPNTSQRRKSTRSRPSGLRLHLPRDEGLRVDHAPAAELRRDIDVGDLLDEGFGIERTEQAGAFEIGAHDPGDVLCRGRIAGIGRREIGNGDRQRLRGALIDRDVKLGARRRRRKDANRTLPAAARVLTRRLGCILLSHHWTILRGSKSIVMSRQMLYLSAGNL